MIATLATSDILRLRGPKNAVSPTKPYEFLVEPEVTARGEVVDVATIFLTNRECPYRCLMCDLWKNTLDDSVKTGQIAQQIRFALERLPRARVLKLYNSGNFFDVKAIPEEDRREIAGLCDPFETVVVENHPKLCNSQCTEFASLLKGNLEVAMGLETVHPEVLPRLNKQMTLEDFRDASSYLCEHGISARAFVLLKPPFLNEDEGIEWAVKSVDFAVDCGVSCVAVIPTRPGNGAVEYLEERGDYSPPRLDSLERVLEESLGREPNHRVFADLWDAQSFSWCDECVSDRIARLAKMNLTQTVMPSIQCRRCAAEIN
ncbi:radical SAM protein [Aporhodopirellula aestuarii]|uniref:Radical SAM protein n=1 Tax=Aporhodopirellula aestuarii TaxID=2950107 RepID=A0ABT0TZ92_9BACT|nr:radical SAM protein [Aporhodopirellula aestuarii]MCM2369929.1 radical SAM protein [Aporhodopirellula aestuarii]